VDEFELKPLDAGAAVRAVRKAAVSPVAAPVVARAEPVNPYAGLSVGQAGRTGVVRRFMYLVLLLGLIPLIVHTWQEAGQSREDRETELKRHLEETVEAHKDDPAFMARMKELNAQDSVDLDDILAVLPNHKLDSALLPKDTNEHWVFGGITAGASMVLLMAMFPGARKRALWLLLAGLFTGTIGILLLLGFQYAAAFSGGMGFNFGGGKIALVLLVLRLIGTRGFSCRLWGLRAGWGFVRRSPRRFRFCLR
jgi:hypothetical protein